MNYKNLIDYIEYDVVNIYNNFVEVFKFNRNDFIIFLFNLVKSFEYNRNLLKKKYSEKLLSLNNLKKVQFALKELGLSEETIKKIIIKSPIIILYSDNLSYVYYLFKNNKYYGYTVLDDGEYNTYLMNENLKSNVISNNLIVDSMLNFYKVNNYNKDEFDKLESDFKLKNYYFKKK